jgi:hypothetical protein
MADVTEQFSAGSRSLLIRRVSAPPAAPWDQLSAAKLEAIRNAPSRNLACQVRRLNGWRPGRAGKFAALYVRAADVGEGFLVRKRIDGRQLKVRFSREHETSVRKTRGVIAASIVGGVLLGAAGMTSALLERHERETALTQMEADVAGRAAQSRSMQAREAAFAAIDRRDDRGEPLAAVLTDISQVIAVRDPAVPIEGLHWRPEGVGVEVRGENAPLLSAEAERSEAPLRVGVWLWALPNTPRIETQLAENAGG